MKLLKNFRETLEKRSQLDLFLIKSCSLIIIYYLLRVLIKFTPFFKPVFIFSKKAMISFFVHSGHFILDLLGYTVFSSRNILYIDGSDGVKVINACLGWATIALYAGFIIVYPGNRKTKWWYILLGVILIVFMNVLRITGMALISYHNPEAVDFYHQYIFNVILLACVFALWIIWIRRFSKKKN